MLLLQRFPRQITFNAALLASASIAALLNAAVTTRVQAAGGAGAPGTDTGICTGQTKGAGGAGGVGYTGQAGGAGQAAFNPSGGGGGGAGGGVGGVGGRGNGNGGLGGLGGTALSPNGANGGNGYGFPSQDGGGGGGGGGYNGNGSGADTITNAATLLGGNGGNGGQPGANTQCDGGGGGGAGGYGAIVTGTGTSTNSGTITGGNAGNGGNGGLINGGISGNGGDGGVGVQFAAPGATFVNSGTINGGNGGVGGAAWPFPIVAGSPGLGGEGIVGGGLSVINSGTISGGLGGDGVTRANAITFSGGVNRLTLQAGSAITGNVAAFSTSDTLAFGGADDSSFAVDQIGATQQYRGFGNFEKVDASTWSLNGANADALTWSILGGTLAANATMQSASFTVGNGGTLSGTGSLGSGSIAAGGTLAPGDRSGSTLGQLTFAGPLSFASGAFHSVRITPTASDSTRVTGTANLGGATVDVQAGSGVYAPDTRYTILSATQGLGDTTFNPTVTTNLAFLSPQLSYDADDVFLTVVPVGDYRSAAVTPNQLSVASSLVQYAGTQSSAGNNRSLFAALNNASLSGAQRAFDQFVPYADGARQLSTVMSSGSFADQLLSCKTASASGDAAAIIREGQCVWLRASAHELTRDASFGNVAYHETGAFYSGGVQFDFGGLWRVGGGIGLETSELATESQATSKGDRFHFGGVVKYNSGPFLLAASVSGTVGWFDTTRTVGIGSVVNSASGSNETASLSGRLTAAYVFGSNALYVKPQIDLALTYLDRGSYVETATGGIGLQVDGSHATVFSASPSVEVGTEWRPAIAEVSAVRAFMRGGAKLLDTGGFSTTASFLDAGPAAVPFTISTKVDRTLAAAAVGIDVFAHDGVSARIQYEGAFGETTRQNGGSAKLMVPF